MVVTPNGERKIEILDSRSDPTKTLRVVILTQGGVGGLVIHTTEQHTAPLLVTC
jgi:hypothetical protein